MVLLRCLCCCHPQVWGENNITVVNSTANLIVGPQIIDVTIRNGSTDAPGELYAPMHVDISVLGMQLSFVGM